MDSPLTVRRVGWYPGIRVYTHSKHGRQQGYRPRQSLACDLLGMLEEIIQELGLLLGSWRTVGAVTGLLLASLGGMEEAAYQLRGRGVSVPVVFAVLVRGAGNRGLLHWRCT